MTKSYELPAESRVRVANMLRLITGSGGRPCKRCGRTIWMIAVSTGKQMPFSDNGVSHFADCPNASEFRRSNSTME